MRSKLIIDSTTAINIVIDICAILMKNGADITRVESSARELCIALGIKEEGILVIPSFITITYCNEQKKKQTASRRCSEGSANLQKIESACNLVANITRGIISEDKIVSEINRLSADARTIWYKRFASYIGVASIFTLIFMGANITVGVSPKEVALHLLSAIICAAVIYCVDTILSKAKISDIFSKMISAILLMCTLCACEKIVTTLAVTEFYSSYVLLGNIMLIVPGIKFTNGIRDLFSGDVASATMHVIEAVFGTIGIVLGVLLVQNVLRCPLQPYPNEIELAASPMWYVLFSVAMAGLGTMFFATFFRIDTRHIWLSFFAGAMTWLVYVAVVKILAYHDLGMERREIFSFFSNCDIVIELSYLVKNEIPKTNGFVQYLNIFLPNLFAACFATVASESVAYKKKIPSMIFLFPAIISLIPGGSLYKAMYSIVDANRLNQAKTVLETIYAAGGIGCGILIVATGNRIFLSIIETVDKKTAHDKYNDVRLEKCRQCKDDAHSMYEIATRSVQHDIRNANNFYHAANIAYEDVISDLRGEKEEKQSIEGLDGNLEYEVYLGAGINMFWLYKCAEKLNEQENIQMDYLEKAMSKYNDANRVVTELTSRTDEIKETTRKMSVLQNWMAVMQINLARHQTKTEECDKYLAKAKEMLDFALHNNPEYAKVYLNFAEVLFIEVAQMLEIQYDRPIKDVQPKSEKSISIEDLFTEMENSLRKAMIWEPNLINAYYKMAQLNTYRIFYYTRCKGFKIKYTIQYQNEAEKWLQNAALRDKNNSGYLYVYREYLELIDLNMAKEVNKVIERDNPISSAKWERLINA